MAASSPRPEIYGPMFLVRDIEASVGFYRRRLGLSGATAGPWAEFRSKGCRFVLLDRGFWASVTDTPMARSTRAPKAPVLLAIQVPNVTKLHARLKRRRVRFELAPTDVPQMGNRIAILADPDGNRVELSTMLTKKDLDRLRREANTATPSQRRRGSSRGN